jgi:hypothetical protein
MDEKLRKLTRFAKGIGLPSVFVGVKSGNLLSYVYEEIPMQDVASICLGCFQNVLEMDVAKHPEYSDERRQVYEDFKTEMADLIKRMNARFVVHPE